MEILVKIVEGQGQVFVNICEKELLGKVLSDGKVRLVINKEFYEGNEMNIDQAFELIESATMASLVGNTIVREAIRRGYVHPDAVLMVENVSFAQVFNSVI